MAVGFVVLRCSDAAVCAIRREPCLSRHLERRRPRFVCVPRARRSHQRTAAHARRRPAVVRAVPSAPAQQPRPEAAAGPVVLQLVPHRVRHELLLRRPRLVHRVLRVCSAARARAAVACMPSAQRRTTARRSARVDPERALAQRRCAARDGLGVRAVAPRLQARRLARRLHAVWRRACGRVRGPSADRSLDDSDTQRRAGDAHREQGRREHTDALARRHVRQLRWRGMAAVPDPRVWHAHCDGHPVERSLGNSLGSCVVARRRSPSRRSSGQRQRCGRGDAARHERAPTVLAVGS